MTASPRMSEPNKREWAGANRNPSPRASPPVPGGGRAGAFNGPVAGAPPLRHRQPETARHGASRQPRSRTYATTGLPRPRRAPSESEEETKAFLLGRVHRGARKEPWRVGPCTGGLTASTVPRFLSVTGKAMRG